MRVTPLFSVLIANYNNGRFINDAIQSVNNQSYNNWEIVFIDDCSTDNSMNIINELSIDNRIHVYRNETNGGVGYTKNRCISLAKGDYCGFLDPDDTLSVDALSIMVDVLNSNDKCTCAYSTHFICNSKLQVEKVADYCGEIEGNDFLITTGKKAISQFACFRRSDYLKTGGMHVDVKKAVDHDLYYMLEEQGEMIYVDRPLYYYRHHDSNISLNSNVTEAYWWDCEVKRRALERRINGQHSLFLQNRIKYYEQYFVCSVIAKRHNLMSDHCSYIQILKKYYSGCGMKNISLRLIARAFLGNKTKKKLQSIMAFLSNKMKLLLCYIII